MKRAVYIAGPISKGDVADNVRRASEAFFVLLRAGLAPFCPQWSAYAGGPYDRPVPDAAPAGTTHEDWMGADLPWVVRADAVLRVPGESEGADLEVARAREAGIPVFETTGAVIAWNEALDQREK